MTEEISARKENPKEKAASVLLLRQPPFDSIVPETSSPLDGLTTGSFCTHHNPLNRLSIYELAKIARRRLICFIFRM
jgi:hypothetical protein